MTRLFCVVPCYNEQEVLPETSKRLKEKIESLIAAGKISKDSRVLFVNDGSRDDTWNIIKKLHESDEVFDGINLSKNMGHQNALLAGLMTAKDICDAAISLDADLQDDINAIDEMVDKYNGDAKIYTAHHLNDLAETIAINLVRGTGWRGLAPFSDTKVVRPFIAEKKTKSDILAEAAKEGIIYRQDPTNTEDNYLRNRLREKVSLLGRDELLKIAELYEKQVVLRSEIEEICESIASEICDDNKYPREIFRDLDDNVAMEILREVCAANNISLTRPQLHDLLIAVREYLPGKKFNLPKDRFVEIRKSWFRF